jgi:multisubunit Na+/H+ antiporter MnhB subunit
MKTPRIAPRTAAAVALVAIFASGLGWFGALHESAAVAPVMYRYYQRHFYEETGTRNAVTAILLTYRMYDTIFEGAILLCSVIGISHFLGSVKKTAEHESEQRKSLPEASGSTSHVQDR